jgi:hypothetical protein
MDNVTGKVDSVGQATILDNASFAVVDNATAYFVNELERFGTSADSGAISRWKFGPGIDFINVHFGRKHFGQSSIPKTAVFIH